MNSKRRKRKIQRREETRHIEWQNWGKWFGVTLAGVYGAGLFVRASYLGVFGLELPDFVRPQILLAGAGPVFLLAVLFLTCEIFFHLSKQGLSAVRTKSAKNFRMVIVIAVLYLAGLFTVLSAATVYFSVSGSNPAIALIKDIYVSWAGLIGIATALLFQQALKIWRESPRHDLENPHHRGQSNPRMGLIGSVLEAGEEQKSALNFAMLVYLGILAGIVFFALYMENIYPKVRFEYGGGMPKKVDLLFERAEQVPECLEQDEQRNMIWKNVTILAETSEYFVLSSENHLVIGDTVCWLPKGRALVLYHVEAR